MSTLRERADEVAADEAVIREGGGEKGRARQQRHGRLTARERIALLLDPGAEFFELSLWAGWGMYREHGGLPAAGVITGIGLVENRPCMIIANDATVKAGAMFPQSIKKTLRAQRIAFECGLPILYLVDSSGVFLPLQDEIFPDEDDFGRIFRNNAVISAAGLPQIAAIMGNCIAGGGYLPVLCDKLVMTEGSGLYLAGPALVKAAIGQIVDTETLGGAGMHSAISGTVDFREKDDPACLDRVRRLVDLLGEPYIQTPSGETMPERESDTLCDWWDSHGAQPRDARELIGFFADRGSIQEFKAEYGKTLVCAYAKIGGNPVGIVASQRRHTKTGRGEIEIGGVIYADSADKAARFVMDCNQTGIPLLFVQDVVGFMVGKDAEQSGIIRSGAKLVSAISNSVVPKVTLIVGDSFGAGHYALCGKAYDPNFILAWPNVKYAVMGAQQAAGTLSSIQQDKSQDDVLESYLEQMDIRFGAARGWVDAVIRPERTRDHLVSIFRLLRKAPVRATRGFHTGVFQT
ncbi:MAG: acyl-CoA carboxylase subunit beta [Verrucomicrobia bacterium]|nr:acyl-CoA carboxylase subunit beta [Verrucomicrobiota bacterium]